MKSFISRLKVPIIQAPMAGGINNPQLASAVTNSGGVGSFGFAYSSPEKVHSDLEATRKLTKGPIHANFFVFPAVKQPSSSQVTAAIDCLMSLCILESRPTSPIYPYYPDLLSQLEPIWWNKPELLSFHFGIPHPSIIEKAHSLGILVGITATSVSEVKEIVDNKADFVILQGIEAGGHRGNFHPTNSALSGGLKTVDLLKETRDMYPNFPKVVAGGIMNGNQIKEVLEYGACAAQLGTAFLTTFESSANQSYKNCLLSQHHRQTVYTQAFSGRYAQGVENKFTIQMENKSILPFPLQNTLTSTLRQQAILDGDIEYQSLWAGSNYHLCRDRSVADIMSDLTHEMSA